MYYMHLLPFAFCTFTFPLGSQCCIWSTNHILLTGVGSLGWDSNGRSTWRPGEALGNKVITSDNIPHKGSFIWGVLLFREKSGVWTNCETRVFGFNISSVCTCLHCPRYHRRQRTVSRRCHVGWNGSFAKWVWGNTRGILQSVTPGETWVKNKDFPGFFWNVLLCDLPHY